MSSRFWPPLGFGAPKNEGKTTRSRCRPPVGLWASLALATGTAAFALLDARRVRHELREMQVENHLQVDTMRAEKQQALGREKELQSQLRSQAAERIHKQRKVDACTDTVKDSKHSSANTIIAAWRRFRVRKLAQKAKHKELKQHLDSASLTAYATQTHCEKPTYDTRAPKFARVVVQHELPEVQESKGKEGEDDIKEANIARMYAEHPEIIAHAKQMEKVAQLRDAASLHENSLKEKGISEEVIQAEIDNSVQGREAARIQRWKLAKAERENTPYRFC